MSPSTSKIENYPNLIEFLDAIPLPGVIIGTDEFVHYANKRARDLFGDLIQDRHYITVMRDPEVSDAIEAVIKDSDTRKTRWATSLSSVDLVFEVHIASIGSQHLLVTFEDSTQVERSNQIRRDFVTNVSHELKTPLTSIIGFLETIQTTAKNDQKAQERFLSIMSDEANRMDRLVNDLMSLNQVESQERSKPTTKIELTELIKETVEKFLPVCKKTNNSVVFENLNEKLQIEGDLDQLQQVISNLIENALKYGGTEKEIKIKLHSPAFQPLLQKQGVVLAVADQGDGIPEEYIPRLTERFYRIDSHRSRQVGGTGLGLSIVKHIVHRHRGRLRIESKIGKGSTFSIYLPIE